MVNKIITELKGFYVLPYFISRKFARGQLLVLGSNNCAFKENEKIVKDLDYHSKKIENAFSKDTHTNDDKCQMAFSIKQILNVCDFESCSVEILNEQMAQLNCFDDMILEEIYYQIQMYKKAFEYYEIFKRVI